jgi:ATP synthase protein I
MQAVPSHRGEMSQGSGMAKQHRTPVPIDNAARRTKRMFNSLSASAVGLEFGISVVIGVLFGMWLDSKAGTSPWLMLLFLLFGLAAGFRGLLRAAKRADRVEQEDRDGDA